MKKINRHFSNVAPKYRELRTTDEQPILEIKKVLGHKHKFVGADIGCGAGRYDLQLFKALKNNLYLYCIDYNEEMLLHLKTFLKNNKIKDFRTIKSSANKLPFQESYLDFIMTFNAIHHFKVHNFLVEAEKSLKKGGYLFIYTRTRTQNKKSVWGNYFPHFNKKEKRLYEIKELQEKIKKVKGLRLISIKQFKYKRTSSIERLLEQATHKHYSTFFLYKNKEFNESLDKFKKRLMNKFEENKVMWYDENILLILKKK